MIGFNWKKILVFHGVYTAEFATTVGYDTIIKNPCTWYNVIV